MMKEIFQLTLSQQDLLLKLARQSIAHGLKTGRPLLPTATEDKQLQVPGACFVTLTMRDGERSELRGCIGSLEARRPLWMDVCENAFAAAFRDPRFPPLSEAEFSRVHLEISVLSPLQEMQFSSEADLLRQIVPFRDGLVLEEQGQRGTFLPLVWDQLTDKNLFLAQLKRKAGLPTHYWSDTLRCYRYHTFVFEE